MNDTDEKLEPMDNEQACECDNLDKVIAELQDILRKLEEMARRLYI